MSLSEKSAREHIAAGLAAGEGREAGGSLMFGGELSTPADRRRLARDFRENAQMERLIVLLDTDPTLREKLNVNLRMSLGFYQHAKAAYEAMQGGEL